MASQNSKLPVELLAQIQNIPVTKELKRRLADPVVQQELSTKVDLLASAALLTGAITLDEIKSDTPARRNITNSLADTIAVDMIAPLMTEPMTQQQMFVMSQIMKYPGQMKEIIAAAMAAGIKSPVFKDL